jgi:hypothetical protein
MLVAYRLAGLSALGMYYAVGGTGSQSERQVTASGIGGVNSALLVGWQSLVDQIPTLAL